MADQSFKRRYSSKPVATNEAAPKNQYPQFQQKPVISRQNFSRVSGTPMAIEALFIMIEEGRYDTRAFEKGCELCRIGKDALWESYLAWKDGCVHRSLLPRGMETK